VRRIAASLATLAALALPASLQAQTGGDEEAEVAFKCAIWASYFAAEYEGRPEATALAYALNYFVGRYEGLTGRGIDQGVDANLVMSAAANGLETLTPVCTVRMEGYGTRMAEWGKALQEIGKGMSENSQ